MDLLLKEFVNYLFDIVNLIPYPIYFYLIYTTTQGIIGIKSIKSFLALYDKYISLKDHKQKQQNYKLFANDLLQRILLEYFENIDKQTLTSICCDLVLKYRENKNVEKVKYAKKLLILYSRNCRKKLVESYFNWSSKTYLNLIYI